MTAGGATIGGATLKGQRILLIEDEAMVAFMIEDMLESFGSVVVEVAGDLSRGLALARDDALVIDAAVLDVNLGGEPVFPLAETLAARGVPFVFSTGYGREGVIPPFDCRPVLAKPFSAQSLAAALLSVIFPRAPSSS